MEAPAVAEDEASVVAEEEATAADHPAADGILTTSGMKAVDYNSVANFIPIVKEFTENAKPSRIDPKLK